MNVGGLRLNRREENRVDPLLDFRGRGVDVRNIRRGRVFLDVAVEIGRTVLASLLHVLDESPERGAFASVVRLIERVDHVPRHGQIGLDVEAGAQMDIFGNEKVLRVGHRDEEDGFLLRERNRLMPPRDGFRNDLNDLFVGLHLGKVDGLHLPLLGQNLEELRLLHQLVFDDDLLNRLVFLFRLLRRGFENLLVEEFSLLENLGDGLASDEAFKSHGILRRRRAGRRRFLRWSRRA